MNFPLSPLDGRYASRVADIAPIFSEFGLARARTMVEITWLEFLGKEGIADIDAHHHKPLQKLKENFTEKNFAKIKEIEATTNHDVKAVEIFLRDYTPKDWWNWIHFGCTSEDINSCSYGLVLQEGTAELLKTFDTVLESFREKSIEWKGVPMLCRTHGQTATPSTMGKEFAVFWGRLYDTLDQVAQSSFMGKFSGATGNFAAHVIAFPDKNWVDLSQKFVEEYLGINWNPLTTQIESHDEIARLLNNLSLASTILIDFSRDIWGYISVGYFGQKVKKGEVGSSTMPHKVNPIDFENAEGNLKLARGIARTIAEELPISRWQRDLTDSTIQRNLGLVFGHVMLALKSLQKGIGKLEIKKDILLTDLEKSPEVLTEAVQTVLRAQGHADAYDQLKAFSRGRALNLEEVRAFVDSTDLPANEKKKLNTLTAKTYTGLSEKLVEMFVEHLEEE